MLAITTDAVEAIRTALATNDDLPDSAGVRISTLPHSLNGHGPAIALELAPAPEEEDEVLEAGEGAPVFVAPEAAGILEGKLLDARVEPGGNVTFSLLEQGG